MSDTVAIPVYRAPSSARPLSGGSTCMPVSISVVIPACDAGAYLASCLQALLGSNCAPLEIIVVDDGSKDDTRAIAARYGIKVLATERRMGPSFARNLAARAATGDILFFLDSDVCVRQDTLCRVARGFDSDIDLDALIGSYDSQPSCPDFISQYRNLMHTYTHQHGSELASTFWSGCGAIRRSVFLEHSGFNEEYGRPAIEDIELGYRLFHAGRKIILDRSIQVTHLKRWTFWGLVKTDILDRGIPWTELILRDKFMPNDLNLQLSQRVSVALVFVLVALSAVLAVESGAYLIIPILAIFFLVLAGWWGEVGTYKKPRIIYATLISLVLLIAWVAYQYRMFGLIPPVMVTPAFLLLRHRYSKHEKPQKLFGWLGIAYICCSVLIAALYLPEHRLLFACFVLLVGLGLLNGQFYVFLAGNRGFSFMLAAIPFHLFYHFYNGVSFIAGAMRYYWTDAVRSSLPASPASSSSMHRIGSEPSWFLRKARGMISSFISVDNRRPFWLGHKDLAVFVAYISMVVFTVHFYQPREDEGIAWMISRLYGIYPLLFQMLRYQGHPGLWYLVLWGPAHLHMPYIYINSLSAMIASLGIYVLLRFSPFPFYARALLPFGFFLGYEFAVVARSYVLFPLLGFIVAELYRRKNGNQIAMAVVLALLANVSIHGTIVAVGFALVCGWNIAKESLSVGLAAKRKHQAFVAAGIFVSSVVFVGVCIWPTYDVKPQFTPEISKPFQHGLYPEGSGPAHVPVGQSSNVTTPNQYFVLTAPKSAQPWHGIAALGDVTAGINLSKRLIDRTLHTVGYSQATSISLALLYDAVLLLYLYRSGKLLLILPAVLLGLFLVFCFAQVWHLGLIWITLLMVLWAAWDSSLDNTALNLQNIVAGTLALLCILQLPWIWGAVRYDMRYSTYPAGAAATYLKTLPLGERMDQLGTGYTVLPYFSENIFIDHGGRPFGHREYVDDSSNALEVIKCQPTLIIIDAGTYYADRTALQAATYRESHSFCGAPYFPNQEREFDKTCLLVLERSAMR